MAPSLRISSLLFFTLPPEKKSVNTYDLDACNHLGCLQFLQENYLRDKERLIYSCYKQINSRSNAGQMQVREFTKKI